MLPFSKPPYVKASRSTIVNSYILEAIGLAADSVFGVVVDDKVAFEQIHPSHSIALLPVTDNVVIDYSDALFYADCFAYEHEIPVLPLPKRRRIPISFLIDKQGLKIDQNTYFHALSMALESVNAMRLGPLAYVEFRHDNSRYLSHPDEPALCLNYQRKYSITMQEIHLYSMALRQIDPFSEFLCLYRVIESASQSNGVDWIQQNLPRVESAKFGMLAAGGENYKSRRKINLFTVLKRFAVSHLRKLRKSMSYSDIAKRIYHVNRCGIAHGRKIRWVDFAVDFNEVYLDSFILRILARLAIEDKL
jgi:hypothetical protein